MHAEKISLPCFNFIKCLNESHECQSGSTLNVCLDCKIHTRRSFSCHTSLCSCSFIYIMLVLRWILQLEWVSFSRCSVSMSHSKAFPFFLGWNKISSRDHGLVEQNLSWLVETESKPFSKVPQSDTFCTSNHLPCHPLYAFSWVAACSFGVMGDSNHSHHKRSAEPPYDIQWCCSTAECSLKIVNYWTCIHVDDITLIHSSAFLKMAQLY